MDTITHPAAPATATPRVFDRAAPSWLPEPDVAMSALRTAVGIASWVHPLFAGRAFGLGPVNLDPSSGFVTRLFGVRDLALGQAVRHPNPEVRRAALQVGVAVDATDVVASLLALRAGAPKPGVVFGGGGAAFFVTLGVLALARGERATATARTAGGG